MTKDQRPRRAGHRPEWRLRAWLAALGAIGVIAGGCGRGDESAAGGRGSAQAAGPAARFAEPPRPPVPVAVEPAATGDIASTYATTATLGAENEAEILARASGVVEALEVEEGDRVQQGQVLLRIDNDEYRLNLDKAEANAASLASRYERMSNMLDKQLVSAEEYETVKADLKLARAEEELARLSLSYTRVQAPIAGRVVSRLVDVGQNVSVGTPLFVVSDFDPLLAEVFVPARELRRLKSDQPVELVLDSTGDKLKGRIKLVSPIIDPQSGTIKITVEVDEYPDHTRPGDFAQVKIVTERRTDRTLVPKIAVVTDSSDRVVYVAADSTAERRVVELGFEDDEHAEILSGLSPGELVIVKGQRSLKHGSPIKVLNGSTAGDRPQATPQPNPQRGSGRRRQAGS